MRHLEKVAWFPPLLARVTVGYVFVESGWGKLHNLDKVVEFFQSLGIPAASLQAPFVAGTELVCGALLFVGLMTRLVSIPLIGTMVVAILTAKREELVGGGFSALTGMTEWLYIVLLVWLVFTGGGKVSVDHVLKKKFCKP